MSDSRVQHLLCILHCNCSCFLDSYGLFAMLIAFIRIIVVVAVSVIQLDYVCFHNSIDATNNRNAPDHLFFSISTSIHFYPLYSSCAEVPSSELSRSHSIVPFTPLFPSNSFLTAAHSHAIHNCHLEPDSHQCLPFHQSILLFSLYSSFYAIS